MSDDLIKRLRFCADLHPQVGYPENGKLFAEAAAEIERLRSALAPCAAILAQQGLPEGREYLIGGAFRVTVSEALDKANAALA